MENQTQTIEITKKVAEVFRVKSGVNSANITIEDMGRQGRISISSSFGSWSNYWGAAGEGFKAFLCGLNMSYFAGKVGEAGFVYEDETIQATKDHIHQMYTVTNEVDVHQYESLMQEIAKYETEYDFEYLGMVLYHNHNYMMDSITGVSPSFKRFWKEIWTPFTDFLKKECENEKKG